MRIRLFALAAILSSAAFAQNDDLRAKLEGKWQTENSSTAVWVIHQKPDSIHIARYQGEQPEVEYECNLLGKECNVKDAGRKATVAVYFNGARLVEIETRGKETIKRRLLVTGGGDAMDLEVIPIVPEGKPEVVHFKRVSDTKP